MPYGYNRKGDSGATVAAGSALSVTTALHDGRLILMDTLAGSTCTLPASEGSGAIFRFFVSVTRTSQNHIIKVANSTDEFLGTLYSVDTSDDSVDLLPCLDADGFDTITMNGGTQGGIKGDYIELEDVAVGMWRITGTITNTGSAASPLSAGV